MKILIIKPSALGDVATALPVLSSLRAAFPDARISWLVRKEFASLLEMAAGLDEIVIFDRKRLDKWWCDPVIFGELIHFTKSLHNVKYDLVIDLQGLFRTGFFSWVTGSSRRFGLKLARELASVFYTDKVRPSEDSCHVIDQYLHVALMAGCQRIVSTIDLESSPEAENKVSELLLCNNISKDNYAVFVPTAAHFYKCWPIERFAEVATRLAVEYSMDIVATGTSGDREYIDKMIGCSNKVFNLAGQTNIQELVALIKGAKLVLSNDTGPGQIASVLRVPMVMIIGPTNPQRIGPYGRLEYAAGIDIYNRRNTIENSKHVYAIENVAVDMVLEKVIRTLENNSVIDG